MKTAKEQTEARLSPRLKRAFFLARKGRRGGRVIGLFRGQNIMGEYKTPEE